MTREASGTSWQPDATGHTGVHLMRGDWMYMLHAIGNLTIDRQGGPRGAYGSGPVSLMLFAHVELH